GSRVRPDSSLPQSWSSLLSGEVFLLLSASSNSQRFRPICKTAPLPLSAMVVSVLGPLDIPEQTPEPAAPAADRIAGPPRRRFRHDRTRAVGCRSMRGELLPDEHVSEGHPLPLQTPRGIRHRDRGAV